MKKHSTFFIIFLLILALVMPGVSYGSWSKPYTLDFGPSGDNIKQGVDKLEDNVDDIYTNLNKLKNTFIGTSAPSSPDTGQIWGDSNHTPTFYKFYNGSIWVPVTRPGYQGAMINGKIAVSVASSDLTVAIKTRLGADPSVTDPVVVRIGDTDRIISAALSVTKADATNWFNSGGVELASQTVDYFVYLGYNATDGVTIGFARIPSAKKYSDFSATSTDEKYCGISTITNAAATDVYEVVGRFDAILSGTAAFAWSLPGTQIIVQRPIYESEIRGWSSPPVGFVSTSTVSLRYKVVGNFIWQYILIIGVSNANNFNFISPFKSANINYFLGTGVDNGSGLATPIALGVDANSNTYNVYPSPALNLTGWTTSGTKAIYSTTYMMEY